MRHILTEAQARAWSDLKQFGVLCDSSGHSLRTLRALERKGLVDLRVWPTWYHSYKRNSYSRGWEASIRKG